jgi:cell fate (sporulation/competence/biofilm development) regulator YlbF (YheA/YmcA/DUF963 family)
MGIFELAAELGRALKDDERLVRLEAARKAYEEDDAILALATEYEAQQRAIQIEAMKEERDDALIETMQGRIDELYDLIVGSETYRELEAAQNEVNELMNSVNSTITYHITGKEPSACTHDCSTCGGCH